jgi:hypothetical protein
MAKNKTSGRRNVCVSCDTVYRNSHGKDGDKSLLEMCYIYIFKSTRN